MRAASIAYNTKFCAAMQMCDPYNFAYAFGTLVTCIGADAPVADLAVWFPYGSPSTPDALTACAAAIDLSTCDEYESYVLEQVVPAACNASSFGLLADGATCAVSTIAFQEPSACSSRRRRVALRVTPAIAAMRRRRVAIAYSVARVSVWNPPRTGRATPPSAARLCRFTNTATPRRTSASRSWPISESLAGPSTRTRATSLAPSEARARAYTTPPRTRAPTLVTPGHPPKLSRVCRRSRTVNRATTWTIRSATRACGARSFADSASITSASTAAPRPARRRR
jgi:hypothetical protein